MSIVEQAFEHVRKEVGLENVKASLELPIFNKLQKSHDSLHQFILTASHVLPTTHRTGEDFFHVKSAYDLYQWEAFDLAHRALFEALCGYYNAAFILLRGMLELIIRGAFFQCFAQKKYRDESEIIDMDARGKQLKRFLLEVLTLKPEIEDELEKISAVIYDKISEIIVRRKFDPSFRTMLKQLSAWGILNGVNEPRVERIYRMYKRLCLDVHVLPDYIDIGRVLLYDVDKLFGPREVMSKDLQEFLGILHELADIGVVMTLNVCKDYVEYDEVRERLTDKLDEYSELDLRLATQRIKELVNH